MKWQTILSVLGLLFVVEGLLPSLSPRLWRQMMQQMQAQNDRTLHIIGLVSMLLGLLLVVVAHNFY